MSAIDELRREIGPSGAAQLPDLSGLDPKVVAEFVAIVRESRRAQRKLLEESAENSLKLVPALLRPAVRKVMFG